jgi:hypothetical protein
VCCPPRAWVRGAPVYGDSPFAASIASCTAATCGWITAATSGGVADLMERAYTPTAYARAGIEVCQAALNGYTLQGAHQNWRVGRESV